MDAWSIREEGESDAKRDCYCDYGGGTGKVERWEIAKATIAFNSTKEDESMKVIILLLQS